ncbi:MAG: hypothetical protein CL947_04750 [Epsilonproteobacteria bacterium]|nr:hypothetical protein [Campylobacterota bacterium]|tara:strand:+ start:8395 stop:8685 length:291 start_codon:yes stop_codon:yes gene_type:complete
MKAEWFMKLKVLVLLCLSVHIVESSQLDQDQVKRDEMRLVIQKEIEEYREQGYQGIRALFKVLQPYEESGLGVEPEQRLHAQGLIEKLITYRLQQK